MAASSAVIGYNSAISVSATQGGSYTDLSEVLSIDDGLDVKEVKVSHLKSDNAAHEYIPGMIEPGMANLELNFYKTQYNTIMSALRTAYWFKITTSDGSITAFKGFYKRLAKKVADGDDRITATVQIKVTGLPTFTAAA